MYNDEPFNKAWVLKELRRRGAIRAVATYSGGNDEGGVEDIYLVFPSEGGELQQSLQVYYGGGYTLNLKTGQYEQTSPPDTDDEKLSQQIAAPIDERYGSWAGEFSAYGTLTIDVVTGEVKMDDNIQSDYDHHEIYY